MTKFEEFKKDLEKARNDFGVKAGAADHGESWEWNATRDTALTQWCSLAAALLITEMDKKPTGAFDEALDDLGRAGGPLSETECRKLAENYRMSSWTAKEMTDQVEMVRISCVGFASEWADSFEFVGYLHCAAANIDNHTGRREPRSTVDRWPPLPRAKAN